MLFSSMPTHEILLWRVGSWIWKWCSMTNVSAFCLYLVNMLTAIVQLYMGNSVFSLSLTMFVLRSFHASNSNTTQTFERASITSCGSDLCPFYVRTAITFSFSLAANSALYWFLFTKLSSVKCCENFQTVSPTVLLARKNKPHLLIEDCWSFEEGQLALTPKNTCSEK